MPFCSSTSSSLDDDEFIWTSPPLQSNPLTQQLKSYEQSTLHCPVCHQFFVNAVSLRPCNHVFCSECIRKALKEGNKIRRVHSCPVCKVETSGGKEENYLVPNWGLQTAVDKYREMRALLYQNILDSQQQQQQQQHMKQGTSRNDSGTMNDGSGSRSTGAANSHVLASASSSSSSLSSRPRRSCSKISKTYSDGSHSDSDNGNETNDSYSPKEAESTYPSTDASASSKNATLAIEKETTTSAIISTKRTMKRMVSYRLHNTKKTQLKRWCKENGLLTQGTDDEMKWRLKHWVDLYNAECDAMKPRSKETLVKELERRERQEKNAKRRTPDKANLTRLKESRKEMGDQSKERSTCSSTMGNKFPTSGSAAYDRTVKNGFNNLIAQYKERKDGLKGVKRKASDLIDDANDSSNSSQPVVASLEQDNENVQDVSTAPQQQRPPSNSPIPQRGTIFSSNTTVSSSNRKQTRTDTKIWACQICTFHNKIKSWSKTKQKCEMCGSFKIDKKSEPTTTTAVC